MFIYIFLLDTEKLKSIWFGTLITVDITSYQLAHKSFVCHFIKSLILSYCYMQLYWPKNEFRKLNVILWMAKNFVDAYYWNSYFALGIRTAIGFEYQSCIWEFRKCSITFSDNIIIQHRLKNTTYHFVITMEELMKINFVFRYFYNRI